MSVGRKMCPSHHSSGNIYIPSCKKIHYKLHHSRSRKLICASTVFRNCVPANNCWQQTQNHPELNCFNFLSASSILTSTTTENYKNVKICEIISFLQYLNSILTITEVLVQPTFSVPNVTSSNWLEHGSLEAFFWAQIHIKNKRCEEVC